MNRKEKQYHQLGVIVIILFLLGLVLSGCNQSQPALTSDNQVIVHFIDVGQGDAILVETSEQNILIDGGNRNDTVLNYLNHRGIQKLDIVIGTHPHADHIGGLIPVLEAIPVAEVIDPGVVHTTKTFEDYLTVIDEKNIKFTEGRAGMIRDLGGEVTMDIIHPSSPSGDHLNDRSIVIKITYREISFMLTGDVERAAEEEMIAFSSNLRSTILKVGHHGSRTSTTKDWLKAVQPEMAIIMVGRDNRYGHPHQQTIDVLTKFGIDIYRTDLHGTIVVTTDGATYTVHKGQ